MEMYTSISHLVAKMHNNDVAAMLNRRLTVVCILLYNNEFNISNCNSISYFIKTYCLLHTTMSELRPSKKQKKDEWDDKLHDKAFIQLYDPNGEFLPYRWKDENTFSKC